MRHLSLQQLSARVDEALSGVSLEIADRHLAGCDECRGRVSRIERLDGLLAQLIHREPGEVWMARMEEEMATRLSEETGLRFRAPPAQAPAADSVRRAPARTPVPALAPLPEMSSIPARARASAVRAPASAGAPPAAPDPATPGGPPPAVPAAKPAPALPVAPRATTPPAAPRPPARRLTTDRPREGTLPLVAGLLAGMAVGALIVSIVFETRSVSVGHRAGGAPAAHSPAGATTPGPGGSEPSGSVEPQRSAPIVTPVEVETLVVPTRPVAPRAAAPRPPQVEREAPRVAAPKPDPAVRSARPAASSAPPVARPSRSGPVPDAPPSSPAPAAASDTQAGAGDGEWPMLCGLVVDDSGNPVSGARVLLADLELGVRTDRRGRFCISGPAGVRTMSVVALGFATHRQLVTVAEPAADLRIVLGPGR